MTGYPFTFAREAVVADPSGALVWPERRLVIVSDLHFGKSQTLARRSGSLLPPYDTRETLARLGNVLERVRPTRVICLGDSFDDPDIALEEDERAGIDRLACGRDWTWVVGNHDPDIPRSLPGAVADTAAVGGLVFRHQAKTSAAAGEVSGHFHPAAAVRLRGRRLRGKCFVFDHRRLILPAFGTYVGGLDATDPAIQNLFPDGFTALLCRRSNIHPLSPAALVPP